MAIKQKLISMGLSPRLAQVVTGTISPPLTATGSDQGHALAMSWDDVQLFGTVASSTGAIFAQAYGACDMVTVINAGANALTVYPASGGAINGGSTNAGVSVSSGATAVFQTVDGLNWWGV